MKLITAVILPSRLAAVRTALAFFAVHGLTISEVMGVRRLQARVEVYRGERVVVDLLPRIRLELLVADADAGDLLRVIARASTSGPTADASICVTAVEHLVRVRTGERGLDAL